MRILIAAVIVTLAPAVARAQAASVKADVDGDGKVDEVRVTDNLEVAFAGKKQAAWKPFQASGTVEAATITVGGPGKAPFVAVSATIRSKSGVTHEGLVVRWQKGALAEVWRGDVGPVGRDGDYEIVVEATAAGLVKYQARADVVRCDGVVAHLFAEAWDDQRDEFRATGAEVGVPASATVIAATRTAPAGAPATSVVYRAAAVSAERGATHAGELAAPRVLDDGNPQTVWSEDRGDDAAGEFVTFRARKRGATLAGLRIVPGDARSAKQLAAANRVARFAVVTANAAYWVDVPDAKGDPAAPWWVAIDPPIAADCVTVVWSTFHPGKGAKAGGGSSVVADLVALGERDVAAGGGDAALVDEVIAGGLDGDSAAKQLARRGASAARAIEAKLVAGVASDARRRLWRVLAQIGDTGSAPELGRGLATVGIEEDEAKELTAGLAKLGEPGQDELAKVISDVSVSDEARLAAAAALADDRREALIGALGPGSRELRKVIATRLAGAGVAWLLAAIEQAKADGTVEREADLWRALGLAAAVAPDADRATAIAALAARGGEVTDYERRYRIIGALSSLDDASAITALDGVLDGLGEGNDAAGLRQVAAAGLARAAPAEAARLLADLAVDTDPGVRLAALKAIAGRDDLTGDGGGDSSGHGRDAVDRVLVNALGGDRWPEVRTTAAAALALACPRAGPTKALESAADGDANDDVRGAALSALVTCDAPGIGDRLLGLARNGKSPLVLRQHAVDLLGVLGDIATAPALVDALTRWRSAAFSEEAGLVLAQSAAGTLGHLGAAAHAAGDAKTTAAVLDALLDTARDPAFPEIQAAGAAGLGALGPACSSDAAKLLKELSRSDQSAVKIAASRALATCH